MKPLVRDALFVRNVVFGVEDSLVSTVGLLSGIAAEHATHAVILSTGVIYIFVEALSMAVGSFLSEESAQEILGKAGAGRAVYGGTVMFVSFIVAGFVPIIPYLLLAGSQALISSIGISLVLLYILGLASTREKKRRIMRAVRMALLGGVAILVGVAVGAVFGVS